jgi:LmbE family N-acetylglucosaminyl deacetylase
MKPISRRDMLSQAGWLGTTVAVGVPLATTAAEPLPGKTPSRTKPKLKVVVTGGHPGDPEYGCGGAIVRYTDLGHEVVLLYLNKGEWTNKPSYDPGPVREAEARKACQILKARPAFAGQVDGKAIVDPVHYDQFHHLLETEQPNIVFTHWPIDNHADHRAISTLVYEAWLRMGKKFALYYYEVSNGEDTVQFAPTHYVDIIGHEPDHFFAGKPRDSLIYRGCQRGLRFSRSTTCCRPPSWALANQRCSIQGRSAVSGCGCQLLRPVPAGPARADKHDQHPGLGAAWPIG